MHCINEDEYMWAKETRTWMTKKEKKWLCPNIIMMVGKEEVDHEHVSLLCSTQVGSPSVSLWYVLWTALRSGHWPDERRYISNHFIHSLYFHCSLSVCLSVCLSVRLSLWTKSNQTVAPIWTRFSLKGCLPHWLESY